jgi:transcriptional antiterminator RfaH
MALNGTAYEQTKTQDAGDWYAAQLRPNGDALAMIHLQRQGFAPFRPQIWERQSRGKTHSPVLRPMFPGYIFVHFDIRLPDWWKIRSTRGVTRLIGSAVGGPYRVPNDLITNLKARCASTMASRALVDFKIGDQVQVVAGPFTDFLATVENVDALHRVRLLIDFMGRTAKLTAKQDDIILKTTVG